MIQIHTKCEEINYEKIYMRLTFQSSPVIMTNNATFVAGEQFILFSSISHRLFSHFVVIYDYTVGHISRIRETEKKNEPPKKSRKKTVPNTATVSEKCAAINHFLA